MKRYMLSLLAVVMMLCPACRETPKPTPSQTATAPIEKPITPPPTLEPIEKPVTPAATQPVATATAPATAPSKPAPRKAIYEETAPYRVENQVLSPSDPQAGWLKVVTMINKDLPASVTGAFPEANRMEVQTENASQITLDLDMLPLKAKTRRILRIDEQTIDLYQSHRGKILLERNRASQWTVLTRPPAK